MANVEQWVMEIPPVTRTWVGLCIASSIAVQCKIVAPLHLYFSWKSTFGKMELWRPFSTFIYFGPLSMEFLIHLFFIMRYSRLLEENSYANRRADFLWLLIVCSAMLLLISPLFVVPFLSGSLAFALVYIWSRRNPSVMMSLMGVITLRAPYLPLALVGVSWAMYNDWRSAVADGMGCVVGHIFWFGMDVWPREMSSKGKGWFETPHLLTRLVDGPPPAPAME